MRILKFGGSSLREPARIEAVVELVCSAQKEEPVTVVFSEREGITDALIVAANEAARGEEQYLLACDRFERRHRSAVDAVAAPEERSELRARMEESTQDFRNLLRGAAEGALLVAELAKARGLLEEGPSFNSRTAP